MSSGKNPGVGLPSVAAQAALCLVLALAFALGGDRLVGIERGFYDLCQRFSAGAVKAPVVIVTPDSGTGDLWTQPGLDELLTTLKASGARVIALAAPVPPPGTAEISRLQSLIRLDQQGGTLRSSTGTGVLQQQLADAESRQAQQQRVAGAARAAGNVVLGLATTERRPGTEAPAKACADRVAATGSNITAVPGKLPAATLASSAPLLCEAAAALGHVALMADRDGIVRRAAPVLATDQGSLPPVALAAAGQDKVESPVSGVSLTRFYAPAPGRGAFIVITASDVLRGLAAGKIRDHYVVLGQAEAGPADSVPTPMGHTSARASLIATELANYLSGDHVWRPGWAIWLEIALAMALALLAVVGGRLSLSTAAMTAVGGMLVLLLAEFLLLAVAGIWLHFAGLALFCLTGVAVLHVTVQLTRPRQEQPMETAHGGRVASIGSRDELDLGFSVLRQQPTTERTKAQLYELAMEHGKKRDYAKAERVFRHLAARDPGYRDVAQKLEKLSGARGAPAAPKGPPGPDAGSATAAPASASPAGRTLGRYELERVIGRGAMATVYLGRDPTINRRVAIKTLPLAEEFADSDLATARSHFLREAESAGRLNHPYIISIHDAGEDNNVAYLAMEYFEGKPLSHYAQLGRLLPPKVVFELMARAAEALHYAHSQNVVHRDVKPANLMYDVDSDRLKLTDFGIARLTDASRTRTGIILGTPSYMSPEQLSASKVTGHTDLYSLGVTMYHLLTGAPPFQADSIPRLMDKIVNQRHRPVSDLRDDVPPCVDSILDRALAKNPADRYDSGKAMALALRECCSTFPAEVL
ncbi:MAG: protein kinase [Gammaproteobacteria bacterium]